MRLIICSISFGFLGLVIGVSLAQLLGGVFLGIIGFFGPPLYVLDKLYAKSMREDTDK